MPNQDKTGPMGQGPMTGRGFGPCGGGYRGFGRRRFRSLTKGEELEALKEEKKMMEEELKEIEERVSELEK